MPRYAPALPRLPSFQVDPLLCRGGVPAQVAAGATSVVEGCDDDGRIDVTVRTGCAVDLDLFEADARNGLLQFQHGILNQCLDPGRYICMETESYQSIGPRGSSPETSWDICHLLAMAAMAAMAISSRFHQGSNDVGLCVGLFWCRWVFQRDTQFCQVFGGDADA